MLPPRPGTLMSDLEELLREAESLDPDDRMRLIAQLWASLPEDYWASPDSRERAHVDAMLAGGDMQGLADLPRLIAQKLFSPPSTRSQEKIYSAPRRFDLATILIVTFAYSLLFGVSNLALNYADFPQALGLVAGGFVTLVGVGQALLFGGQNARVASLLTGAVLTVLLNLAAVIWPPRGFAGIALVFMLPFSAVLGAAFGYMAGALVGGVFLVADKLRTYFESRSHDTVVEEVVLVEIERDRESNVST
jgi:hypothetical protein